MSSHPKTCNLSTSKIRQWLGLTRPQPLSDSECYEKLYGNLICYVPHYRGIYESKTRNP